MTSLLAAVTAGTVLLVLAAGCLAHVSRPHGLPDALRAHRVLPARSVPAVAVAVPCAEGLLAIAGAATLLTDFRPALPLVLCAAAGLFTAYALYARRVTATGRSGPCGCSRTDVPMDGWIATRAGLLALCAVTGAVLFGPLGATLPAGGTHRATATLATAAFAALLWTLPAAMHEPAPVPAPVPNRAPAPVPTSVPDRVPTPAVAHRTSATGGPQWTS